MGGELGVGVGADSASLSAEVLAERGADAARLIAEVARQPLLPPSELARVKAGLARDLAIQKSTPQALAQESFHQVIYGDHPYGRLFPTEAMLDGYTLEQVRAFHQARYGAGRARGCTWPACSTPRRWSARSATPSAPGRAARRRLRRRLPAAARQRRFALLDRPGAPAVHDLPGPARARPVERRLDCAAGDRLAARRVVRLAHHDEHPRAEGLHLLAVQLDEPAPARRLLGRGGRRDDARSPARR